MRVVVILVVAAVTAWIADFRSRQRIRKALGRKAKDGELTSIKTWIDVEAAEKRKPLG